MTPLTSSSLDLNVDPEITEPLKKSLCDPVFVAVSEVLGPEVVILDAVAEHEIGSREHGCGDRDNRFFWSTAALEAKKLGLKIAALLPGGCPCRLNQAGFQPGCTVARAGGATLPRALIKTGTESRPGHEMTGGRKA